MKRIYKVPKTVVSCITIPVGRIGWDTMNVIVWVGIVVKTQVVGVTKITQGSLMYKNIQGRKY